METPLSTKNPLGVGITPHGPVHFLTPDMSVAAIHVRRAMLGLETRAEREPRALFVATVEIDPAALIILSCAQDVVSLLGRPEYKLGAAKRPNPSPGGGMVLNWTTIRDGVRDNTTGAYSLPPVKAIFIPSRIAEDATSDVIEALRPGYDFLNCFLPNTLLVFDSAVFASSAVTTLGPMQIAADSRRLFEFVSKNAADLTLHGACKLPPMSHELASVPPLPMNRLGAAAFVRAKSESVVPRPPAPPAPPVPPVPPSRSFPLGVGVHAWCQLDLPERPSVERKWATVLGATDTPLRDWGTAATVTVVHYREGDKEACQYGVHRVSLRRCFENAPVSACGNTMSHFAHSRGYARYAAALADITTRATPELQCEIYVHGAGGFVGCVPITDMNRVEVYRSVDVLERQAAIASETAREAASKSHGVRERGQQEAATRERVQQEATDRQQKRQLEQPRNSTLADVVAVTRERLARSRATARARTTNSTMATTAAWERARRNAAEVEPAMVRFAPTNEYSAKVPWVDMDALW
jgi:hypothetical protein